jgi:Uma2 family endonuclease
VVIRATSSRRLIPGTTGWSVRDLDNPQIERQWDNSHYEIVEGVLTKMPPAYYDGGVALANLIDVVRTYVKEKKLGGHFAAEVDFILSDKRLLKPDTVYLSPEAERLQKEANAQRGKRKLAYGRLLLPPTLVIESVSLGHEAHDYDTKRAWYAEFRVPNYWLLNAHQRTLECLVLEGNSYRVDQAGKHNEQLRPAAFPGLTINLGELWLD